MTAAFGDEEGAVCWRNGCQGVIALDPVEGCSCHISPPCSQCTEPREFCGVCGWHASEEDEHLNGFVITHDKTKPKVGGYPMIAKWERRPLDPRKIDYHLISTGSGCTQIAEGVYPEGTTSEEVRAVVDGTFGGRFDSFGNGKFRFTRYTD